MFEHVGLISVLSVVLQVPTGSVQPLPGGPGRLAHVQRHLEPLLPLCLTLRGLLTGQTEGLVENVSLLASLLAVPSLAGMTLTPPTVSRAPGVTLDQQLLDGGAGPLDNLHFLPRQLCELDL